MTDADTNETDGLNDRDRGELCSVTSQCLQSTTGQLGTIPKLIKKIILEQAWQRRWTHGKIIELNSLRELVTERPIRGWGEDPERIEALIRHDQTALDMFREAMLGEPGRPNLEDKSGNNVTGLERVTGNSRAYSLGRVRRECDPETARAVFAGELSPHAALVKAGIREVRTVYFPRDPSQALAKIRKVLGDEYVDAMLASEVVHGT